MTDSQSSRERRTPARRRVLLLLAVALGVAVGVEAWYVVGGGEPTPSADRPVVIGTVTYGSAVASAARSTEEILSYGFEDLDAQVEDAAPKMTEAFAAEFEETVAAAEERIVEQRITQEVRVVASSVISASDEEVQALLFLDQYVAEAGKGTSVTPYRAVVTVQRDDGAWLVSDIETD